jgi:hypothetical protein
MADSATLTAGLVMSVPPKSKAVLWATRSWGLAEAFRQLFLCYPRSRRAIMMAGQPLCIHRDLGITICLILFLKTKESLTHDAHG